MLHVLQVDSDSHLVSHYIDSHKTKSTISLKEFLAKFAPRTIDLGLLPPVTKLITPVYGEGDRRISVLVEHAPCKRVLIYEVSEYLADQFKIKYDDSNGDTVLYDFNLTLPWHSFLFNFFLTNENELYLDCVSLFFHKEEILSEASLNSEFLLMPYLPNIFTSYPGQLMGPDYGSNVCYGDGFSDVKAKPCDFIYLYNSFMTNFWGTTFNTDLPGTLCEYYANWYEEDYCGMKDLVKEYSTSKDKITSDIKDTVLALKLASTFTYQQAIDSLLPMDITFGQEGKYMVDFEKILNPVFNFNQLLSVD